MRSNYVLDNVTETFTCLHEANMISQPEFLLLWQGFHSWKQYRKCWNELAWKSWWCFADFDPIPQKSKKKFFLIFYISDEKNCEVPKFNGRVSLCRYRQKQKVIKISPLLAFWIERAKEWKFWKIISLVRNNIFQILFLFLVQRIV